MDSPKAWVKHGHPGPSISGAAEQEVLPDGHVTDEWEDEEHHAEHDEPQRAGYTHHPAPLPDDALNSRAGCGCSGHQDAPRWAQAPDANTPRTPDRFQKSSGRRSAVTRRASAGSNRPRSQTAAMKMTEAVICGSAHRNEGATQPECDALTVDAERRVMRGWGEGVFVPACCSVYNLQMLQFSCGVLKKMVASLSSCLLINKPGASQSADSALLFDEEIRQQQQQRLRRGSDGGRKRRHRTAPHRGRKCELSKTRMQNMHRKPYSHQNNQTVVAPALENK